MKNQNLELSVIIISWNTKELLKQCLKSLGQWHQKGEVIVVDNGSSDCSPEMVEKHFPEIKLIKNSRNLGFAKANNQGIEVARGQYVFFT